MKQDRNNPLLVHVYGECSTFLSPTYAVEPPNNGHTWDPAICPLLRGLSYLFVPHCMKSIWHLDHLL